jgi:GntR family transcriptional repressor for pyruvate dehydrogenase complex
MYETVQTSRKYEQIVEQIMNLVADGTLNVGDQLPAERELAQQFGVSRTAVREAVKALRERGLVQIHPGRGTYISDYSLSASGIVQDSLAFMVRADDPTGPDELQQVRYLLEPAIAALAAEKATPQNLELLQILIDKMDDSLDNQEAYVQADLDFHLALARATQNSLIPVLIIPVIGLLREQRLRIFEADGGPERGQFHHKHILKTVSEGDSVGARLAMEAHLKQVQADSPSFTN